MMMESVDTQSRLHMNGIRVGAENSFVDLKSIMTLAPNRIDLQKADKFKAWCPPYKLHGGLHPS
jgi:hypothetical protein